MASHPTHLEPSELGTKEYWDTLYTTELSNNTANPSDIGTCWFDDSDAEGRTVSFLASLADDGEDDVDGTILPEPLPRQDAAFLDLGCGNGSLLFALRDDGWKGRMLGVDYSAKSVALAKQIALTRSSEEARAQNESGDIEQEAAAEKEEEEEDIDADINFLEWDLVSGPITPTSPASPTHTSYTNKSTFDIILDKGTFDAISLSEATDANGRRLVESYRERMLQLLQPEGGLFLITSCNWTESELRAWFEKEEDALLKVVGRIEYPTFTFGGSKGQTISTLCFRRG